MTQAEARAIVGAPVRQPFEAPQGPTCIYRTEKGRGLVTLAVQAADFKRAKGQLQQATRVSSPADGRLRPVRPADALRPGLQGRVLTVAAPCDVAKQFASKAVKRLGR